MKHIVSRSEKEAGCLIDSEVNTIIRAGHNYLFEKHGRNADVSLRKSLADTIHALFPQVSSKTAFAKLSTKLYNKLRKPKAKSVRKKVEVHNKEVETVGDGNSVNGLHHSNTNKANENVAVYLDDDVQYLESDAEDDDKIIVLDPIGEDEEFIAEPENGNFEMYTIS